MPVSRTATTAPLPENGDLSAPTALTPHVAASANGPAPTFIGTGAINFIGMTGATDITSFLRSISIARRGCMSSTSIVIGGGAETVVERDLGNLSVPAASAGLRRMTYF